MSGESPRQIIGSPPRAWGQPPIVPYAERETRFTPTGVGTTRAASPPPPSPSVHPHGRGDNHEFALEYIVELGSPPRAWGQPPRAGCRARLPRFTPTGVGTTVATGGRPIWNAVHPHGRGDNQHRSDQFRAAIGSPPRAWGQPDTGWHPHYHVRFTPTGVGTTRSSFPSGHRGPVHPHGRGDNIKLSSEVGDFVGSPPRAWGQRHPPHLPLPPNRFTPTGVGTTPFPTQPCQLQTVHPHGRGDNELDGQADAVVRGSPPRAWGQRERGVRPLQAERFTPTGVGTTSWAWSSSGSRSVHPHGRGDNPIVTTVPAAPRGSPPRAWGQPWSPAPPRPSGRFTPTGVGTTGRRGGSIGSPPVHPHGRGDNWLPFFVSADYPGSPPRAWGQPPADAAAPDPVRFTPTGVGTTPRAADRGTPWTVHPHGRGDNDLPLDRSPWAIGSPPRAWGQRTAPRGWNGPWRFTPTGVGTTAWR